MKVNESNAEIIAQELGWFQQPLLFRGKISFEQSEPPEAAMEALIPLSIEKIGSPYTNLIQKHQMGMAERLVLILDFFPI